MANPSGRKELTGYAAPANIEATDGSTYDHITSAGVVRYERVLGVWELQFKSADAIEQAIQDIDLDPSNPQNLFETGIPYNGTAPVFMKTTASQDLISETTAYKAAMKLSAAKAEIFYEDKAAGVIAKESWEAVGTTTTVEDAAAGLTSIVEVKPERFSIAHTDAVANTESYFELQGTVGAGVTNTATGDIVEMNYNLVDRAATTKATDGATGVESIFEMKPSTASVEMTSPGVRRVYPYTADTSTGTIQSRVESLAVLGKLGYCQILENEALLRVEQDSDKTAEIKAGNDGTTRTAEMIATDAATGKKAIMEIVEGATGVFSKTTVENGAGDSFELTVEADKASLAYTGADERIPAVWFYTDTTNPDGYQGAILSDKNASTDTFAVFNADSVEGVTAAHSDGVAETIAKFEAVAGDGATMAAGTFTSGLQQVLQNDGTQYIADTRLEVVGTNIGPYDFGDGDGAVLVDVYRAVIDLGPDAENVYATGANPEFPFILATEAKQVAAPFGSNLGPVDPSFYTLNPASEYDSWLGIGNATGGEASLSPGFDTVVNAWTKSAPLVDSLGNIFLLDPNSTSVGNTGTNIVLAQIAVPAGTPLVEFKLGFITGKSVSPLPDWTVNNIEFTTGTATLVRGEYAEETVITETITNSVTVADTGNIVEGVTDFLTTCGSGTVGIQFAKDSTDKMTVAGWDDCGGLGASATTRLRYADTVTEAFTDGAQIVDYKHTSRHLGTKELTTEASDPGPTEDGYFLTWDDAADKFKLAEVASGTNVGYTYYVAADGGNDTTAAKGDLAKPYATISGAIAQAVADKLGGYTGPQVVHVFAGQYTDTEMQWQDGTIYFEAGAEVTGIAGSNMFDIGSTSLVTKSNDYLSTNMKILGHGKFFGGPGTFMFCRNAYECVLEFDLVNISAYAAFRIYGTGTFYAKGRKVENVSTYGINFIDSPKVYMDIDWVHGTSWAFTTGTGSNTFSGKKYLKFKQITGGPSFQPLYLSKVQPGARIYYDFTEMTHFPAGGSQYIINNTSQQGGYLKVVGNVFDVTKGYITGGLCTGGTFEYVGNMHAGITAIEMGGGSGPNFRFIWNGNITYTGTGNTPVQLGGGANVTMTGSLVNLGGSTTTSGITLINAGNYNFHNFRIEGFGVNSIIGSHPIKANGLFVDAPIAGTVTVEGWYDYKGDFYYPNNAGAGKIWTSNNDGLGAWATPSGGNSYELIGTITSADINANAGSSNFTVGSIPYPTNKVIDSILVKVTATLDVDNDITIILQDITNSTLSTNNPPLAMDKVANYVSNDHKDLAQTNGGNYAIYVSHYGPGLFAGGNTTGTYEVYAKYVSY